MSRDRWAAAAALAGAFLTVAVFFPGFMSTDSFVQLGQARTHAYNDWHPPVMAWTWGLCESLVRGPVLMLVLQAASLWAGAALIARNLAPGRLAPLVVLAIGLWPPVFAMSGTIWKDVQMASAFVLATGLLLAADDRRAGRPEILAVVLLIYGTCMRHNAVFAATPLAVWAGCSLTGRRQGRGLADRAVAVAAVLAALVLAPPAAARALGAARTYPIQQLQVFDLAGISTRVDQLLIPAGALPPGYDLATLHRNYNPGSIGYLYWARPEKIPYATDSAVASRIQGAWLDAIRTHPVPYLRHRLAAIAIHFCITVDPSYPYHVGVDANSAGVTWEPSAFSRGVFALLGRVRTTLPFRPWPYVAI